MGSRGRSIRLRIYFLVAIPLITMLGLFGYVAYTSITNFQNLDRAPGLVKATGEPAATAMALVNTERTAAVVYASAPTASNLGGYEAAIKATEGGVAKFDKKMTAPGVTSTETPAEAATISKMISDFKNLKTLRLEVEAKKLGPLQTLGAYTTVTGDVPALFEAESNSLTNASALEQGLGEVAVDSNDEDIQEQGALLAGAFAAGTLTPQARAVFDQAAGRQQDDSALLRKLLSPAELAAYDKVSNEVLGKAKNVTTAFNAAQGAVLEGLTLPEIEQATGLTGPEWQQVAAVRSLANFNGGLAAAAGILTDFQGIANSARRTVYLTGAIGAAGLLLTLLVTILLGRSINRRLTVLRRSALTLAQEQLPSVVTRLRRGEPVDMAAEAPPLRVGRDEIGQVGQAIETVRETAIRSAVEEARVRQGVNDMFRNLARRNQSLLQRQLGVIDDMERKAQDPDVLEDLFKMDHLTTRMRRHAEGLIILSGAPPGRSWSAPVKLIDVMRGAVAEVEDYARVTVSTQSRAALAGSAVTDVIHLLAELIENATTLSPPFTPVRVGGETVANGFAIEIEDRGLGMTPQRFDELNDRLANPPDINPANTEQLGLFVVGQLARRHGISVVLRPSPYGGTTAVALIPRDLIVEDGPAAITAGGLSGATGRAAGYEASGGYGAAAGAMGPWSARHNGSGAVTVPPAPGAAGSDWPRSGGWSEPGDPAGSGDWPEPAGWPRANGWSGSGSWADSGANGAASPGPAGYGPATSGAGYPSGPATSGPATSGDAYPSSSGTPHAYDDSGNPPIRVAGALRHPAPPSNGAGPAGTAEPGSRRGGRHGNEDVPVVTGVPVGRPTAPSLTPFDVFTPIRRSGSDGIPQTAPAAPADTSYAQAYPDFGGAPADSGYGNFHDGGDNRPAQEGYPSGNSAVGEDYKGLPRRVRQANLAPQLRASARAGAAGETGVPPATAASLTDMRNTLSAMQRGWQQGRSQSPQDIEGRVDGE